VRVPCGAKPEGWRFSLSNFLLFSMIGDRTRTVIKLALIAALKGKLDGALTNEIELPEVEMMGSRTWLSRGVDSRRHYCEILASGDGRCG
jgi:hypothetical protein